MSCDRKRKITCNIYSRIPLILLVLYATGTARSSPATEDNDVVQVPPLVTTASKLRSYTPVHEGMGTPNQRIWLRSWPLNTDKMTLVIDGVQPGDEVLKIDGVDVKSLDRKGIDNALVGSSKLLVKHWTTGKSFKTFEVDSYRR
jgi:hypothetical protein